MAKRVNRTAYNANSFQILNSIFQNSRYAIGVEIPQINDITTLRTVGEYVKGNPIVKNFFLNEVINRIAFVRMKSVLFNNPYVDLKKGFLEHGETVEEIYTGLIKAVHYDPNKAPQREFKRSIPDVRAVFYNINWRVVYPVTIDDKEIDRAFLNENGVIEMIDKIVNSLYTSANYDEFLLFKYLFIKEITKGRTARMVIDTSDMNNTAVAFRTASNNFTFVTRDYNYEKVEMDCPRERQVIFMDSNFEARFDVEVLARAFNMDKAMFTPRLYLIDAFNTFDNARFEDIQLHTDFLPPVTDDELALMNDVKAILVDRDYFQFYDEVFELRRTQVNSGLYDNYFLHSWKTVSPSPFANILTFVDGTGWDALPNGIAVKITGISENANAVVYNFESTEDAQTAFTKYDNRITFVQTDDMTSRLIASLPYGAIMRPKTDTDMILLEVTIGSNVYRGELLSTAKVDDVIVLGKDYIPSEPSEPTNPTQS